jgi:hypothetical protein
MVNTPILPGHAERCHFNVGLVRLGSGFNTHVHFWNYFVPEIYNRSAQRALVDLEVYDARGACVLRERRSVESQASAVVDLGAAVAPDTAKVFGIGTVHARLIPIELPSEGSVRTLPTEFMVEISHAGGSCDIAHNIGGRRSIPNVTRMSSGLWFADSRSNPRYLIFAANYFGPSLPVVSRGAAALTFLNHRGVRRTLSAASVPARGALVVDLKTDFPDMIEFLDGNPARVGVSTANMISKPWIWYESSNDGMLNFCIDHL